MGQGEPQGNHGQDRWESVQSVLNSVGQPDMVELGPMLEICHGSGAGIADCVDVGSIGDI